MNSREEAAGASKAYGNVNRKLATTLGLNPKRSGSPSGHFDYLREMIPKTQQKAALKWYKKGIRRGLIEATKMILNNEISIKKQNIKLPKILEIEVKTRFKGESWIDRSYKFKRKEILSE